MASSVPLYSRKVRIAVETLLVQDLRVQFKVRKTLKKEPNSCELSISNLNENSRASLQRQHVKVVVEAGYPENIAQIFSGVSRYVDQVQEGASWTTRIQCGDGEREFRYRRISESFRPGTSVRDVLQTVGKSIGLPIIGLGYLDDIDEQFLGGYSAFGKSFVELDKLLKPRGLEWSIQDSQLQILPLGQANTQSVILLSPETGLVGSPEHGNPEKQTPLDQLSGSGEDQGYTVPAARKKGPAVLKVKSLLQPGLKPGRRVQVKSRGVNGVFRIETVEHSGDTAGGDWYSDLECLPL